MKKFNKKQKLSALIIGGILAAVVMILFSCDDGSTSNSSSSSNSTGTSIVFDNTNGTCKAIVYDDSRRRDEDKVVEVEAGLSSAPKNWTAHDSYTFYFRYVFSSKDAPDIQFTYIAARIGKDQVPYRIENNKSNTLIIPSIVNAIGSADELLSEKCNLIIENTSEFSIQFMQGSSPIKPEGTDNSLVHAGENPRYELSAGNTSSYKIYCGGIDYAFPSGDFKAGYIMRYRFDRNSILFQNETPVKISTIQQNAFDGTSWADAGKTNRISFTGNREVLSGEYWNNNVNPFEFEYRPAKSELVIWTNKSASKGYLLIFLAENNVGVLKISNGTKTFYRGNNN
jgi:hypothetical protein